MASFNLIFGGVDESLRGSLKQALKRLNRPLQCHGVPGKSDRASKRCFRFMPHRHMLPWPSAVQGKSNLEQVFQGPTVAHASRRHGAVLNGVSELPTNRV